MSNKTFFRMLCLAMLMCIVPQIGFAERIVSGIKKKLPGEPPEGSPDAELVLWHTYNGTREDVLDWSHHGSIGEFLQANRIPTKNGKGLLLSGQYSSSGATNYHIMPNDVLNLKQGTVTFWICVDPMGMMKKRGAVLSLDNNRSAMLAVVGYSKGQYQIAATFGPKIQTKMKLDEGKFYHVAWVFTPEKQELWINNTKDVELDQGAELHGENGMYVGCVNSGSKNKKTDGLAAILDDLRIYRVPKSRFNGVRENPTLDEKNPTGLLLDLNFNPKLVNKDKTRIRDESGRGLEIRLRNPGTVKGPKCPLIKKDDGSIGFVAPKTTDTGKLIVGTQILIMPHETLKDLKEGTMEIYFRVSAPSGMDSVDYHLVSSSSLPHEKPGETPKPDKDGQIRTFSTQTPDSYVGVHVWRPKADKEDYLKNNFKMIPFMEVRIRSKSMQFTRRTGYMFKPGQWMHLVFSWNEQTSNVWINGVRISNRGNVHGFVVFPTCVFALGSTQDRSGFAGDISRFRVWNYKLRYYPGELPPEGNMPTFHLKD